MSKLEDLKNGALVEGLMPNASVTVRGVKWMGGDAIDLAYETAQGVLGSVLLYRDDEPRLKVVEPGAEWSFDADASMLRLASEAYRIRMAHLFDPLLAVNTSIVEPLPHQITAVYETMLQRHPLRYVLADDPGAGKTIMAGLFIKELIARGDLRRCLIVAPGNLVEQWQEELNSKFQLHFNALTNDGLTTAPSGNWFSENDLALCRLDKLSRDEAVQGLLVETDWDVVVCDEAHKMSASYFGGEVKYTKRYRLGQQLTKICRHLLLLTATPHNGKDADFQLFMALVDGDRFEGQYRDGAHTCDVSDILRRMVKEDLLKFDGCHLFPERYANTVNYKLSDPEALLYKEVTDYVREEFNRADHLSDDGRKGTVGFALTSLQRRLASSPEAIYQSILRRKARLEKRIKEEQLLKRGAEVKLDTLSELPAITAEWEEDLEDAPDSEKADEEEQITERASAAQTIQELQAEIEILSGLERLAADVRRSGTDKKWEQLSRLLQETPEMRTPQGGWHKLVIFTEFLDTLRYLEQRIKTLLGRDEAVVIIHGAMGRDERRKMQDAFTQDKDVQVLVATDAAGEGINLQRAHLMVNYDLPWNPNRLEQRFGRIHRIGQTEVCHLWNLVAPETREGEVYSRLLEKIEAERMALGGRIFNVLGRLFQDRELRELLIEAIRYGDKPEVRAKINKVIDKETDHGRLRKLLEDHALTTDTMDISEVMRIRDGMERFQAQRLQPRYISAFFREAFPHLGGTIYERETDRFEITNVPARICQYDQAAGTKRPVLKRYERVAFDKAFISVEGRPMAEFICPGHPLLDAVINLILQQHGGLLKSGALLVDELDESQSIRALFYLQHDVVDARKNRDGSQRVISQRMQFVFIGEDGAVRNAGPAPYLDFRPVSGIERELLRPRLEMEWLKGNLAEAALSFAAAKLVPLQLAEVRKRREEHIEKTTREVKRRLEAEIQYWDNRANVLKAEEQAGKQPKMNWQRARERADDLAARLVKRTSELELERQIMARPPQVVGGALVIPIGLLRALAAEGGDTVLEHSQDEAAKRKIEALAMKTVFSAESKLGNEPKDVSASNYGYDIESRDCHTSRLRFIEVKGRAKGATTVTVSKNEILTALNEPEAYILAVVQVEGEQIFPPIYIHNPFTNEPDWAVTSVNYDLNELMSRGVEPL